MAERWRRLHTTDTDVNWGTAKTIETKSKWHSKYSWWMCEHRMAVVATFYAYKQAVFQMPVSQCTRTKVIPTVFLFSVSLATISPSYLYIDGVGNRPTSARSAKKEMKKENTSAKKCLPALSVWVHSRQSREEHAKCLYLPVRHERSTETELKKNSRGKTYTHSRAHILIHDRVEGTSKSEKGDRRTGKWSTTTTTTKQRERVRWRRTMLGEWISDRVTSNSHNLIHFIEHEMNMW